MRFAADLFWHEPGGSSAPDSPCSHAPPRMLQQAFKSALAPFDALGISVRNAEGAIKNTDQLLSEIAGKFRWLRRRHREDGACDGAIRPRRRQDDPAAQRRHKRHRSNAP